MSFSYNIKILFIAHTVQMGGANHSMLQLMLELREKFNITPIVLMPHMNAKSPKWNLYAACVEKGIRCYSFRFYWFTGVNRVASLMRYLSNILFYPYILYKLRSLDINIVHTNGSVVDIGMWISKMKKVPHVWHLREYGDLDFNLQPVFGRKYQSFVYRHGGDAFIAISDSIRKYYQKLIPNSKLHLIYNGIIPPPIENYAEHNNSCIKFCILGRLSAEKNGMEALHAIKILKEEYKEENFRLTLIGKNDGAYAKKMVEYANANNLSEFIAFLGERKDIREILKQEDVGLMLSRSEAFGRVTVEYMMQNLAVIASNSGANSELIENGVTGFLYQPGNVWQLANTMRGLMKDKKMLCKIASKGQKEALNKFTSQRNSSAIKNLYDMIIYKNDN